MIKKSALAVVAALLMGSATNAFADAASNDANTGLWTTLYYGTLADLQKQGLPISAAAQKYLKEHPAPVQTKAQARAEARAQANAGKRGNVFLLEDTQGIVSAPRYLTPDHNSSDFQSSFTYW